MVILPGCECCEPCSRDDSDGDKGTAYEDSLLDDGGTPDKPSRWLTVGVTFDNGAQFTGGYMARCTYIDLARDADIEIQTEAQACSGTFSILLDDVPYGSLFGFGNAIRFLHDPEGGYFYNTPEGQKRYDGLVLYGSGTVLDSTYDKFAFGKTGVIYVARFSYVGGAWSASLTVNGQVVFDSVDCPQMSLSDRRFYHGLSGSQTSLNEPDLKQITRYYMKLTYR